MDIQHFDGVTSKRWDLSNLDEIEQALDMVRRDKPFFVSLSPPCTKCCALLRLCRHPVDRREWIKAVRMVNVAVKMAEIQLNAGRHFLFEHPLTARSC